MGVCFAFVAISYITPNLAFDSLEQKIMDSTVPRLAYARKCKPDLLKCMGQHWSYLLERKAILERLIKKMTKRGLFLSNSIA